MNKYSKKPRFSDLNETIKEIQNLVDQPGYIYSLLTIAFNDLFQPIEKYVDINWWDLISYQELGFIFGLLIKEPLRFDVYPSKEHSQNQIDDTYKLLQKMHNNYSFTAFDAVMDTTLKSENKTSENHPTIGGVYNTPESIIESVFYNDSGAYDFQYWDSAPVRYARDDKWIKKQFGFSIQDMVELSMSLKELSEKKRQKIPLTTGSKDIYDWILDTFSFKTSDISNITDAKIKALDKLSVTPGKANANFNYISDFNELVVKPIIRLSDSTYLLPISFDLARSVDESPFYWIKETDVEYFENTASDNRGKYTEEASFEHLKKIFGESNVFLDLQVHRNVGKGIKKKGKNLTDIDVLALAGKKAVIIQAKSKKLTLPSRQGDIEILASDFKSAVQDAYNQGIIARSELLSGDAILIQKDGTKLKLAETLNEVYIITLTTDNYPAIAFQIHNFLKKQDNDPYPIAINLYDLDLLSHYLPDPFDFLYYLNQRTSLAPIIIGSTEISCLGYHMSQKLYIDPQNKPDLIHIAPDFGQIIDDDVIRQRYGSIEDSQNSKIRNSWKNKSLEKLVLQIKSSGIPDLADAVFFLYSLSSETADKLISMIESTKASSKIDHQPQIITIPLDHINGGITYVVECDQTISLHEHIMAYSITRKYINKAGEWLGLGSFTNSSDIIDSVVYTKDPWKENSEIQKLVDIMTAKPEEVVSRKIGRNDPCYCGSGKKYKKCHLLIKN